jgi:hypothetical protein
VEARFGFSCCPETLRVWLSRTGFFCAQLFNMGNQPVTSLTRRNRMNVWLLQSLKTLGRMGNVSLLRRGISLIALTLLTSIAALAEPAGGEAALRLPDLSSVSFFNGAINGHNLLLIGILFCVFGLLFGLAIYTHLKNLPVHRCMLEISELIYETCKTYLVTQGKFILILWAFIAVVIAAYFGWLAPVPGNRLPSPCRSSWASAWWVSRVAMVWPGSAFASILSPIPARHLPDCAANPSRSMTFR